MNTERVPEWLPTFLVPFFSLSYPSEPPDHPDSFTEANYYSTGLLDGWLIITCIAVMAILRDVLRIFVMEPFAHWYLTRKYASEPPKEIGNGSTEPLLNGNGHTTQTSQSEKNDAARKKKRDERLIRRSVLRFAEQGWSVIYYTIQWGFGVVSITLNTLIFSDSMLLVSQYVHCNLPTAPFNPTKLWLNYPHIPLSGPLKFYYTTQTAFYLHQILILNAEARRKDHYQMMTHHVITIALMVASYFYNFTRVGCLIMVLMDLCDIFLPVRTDVSFPPRIMQPTLFPTGFFSLQKCFVIYPSLRSAMQHSPAF